jgi:hypothetical protein
MQVVKIRQKIKGWRCFVYSIYELKVGGFKQFAHHFNENCLKILIFYSKLKSDHNSSIFFKVQNQILPPVFCQSSKIRTSF